MDIYFQINSYVKQYCRLIGFSFKEGKVCIFYRTTPYVLQGLSLSPPLEIPSEVFLLFHDDECSEQLLRKVQGEDVCMHLLHFMLSLKNLIACIVISCEELKAIFFLIFST